jgi:hypothetical protein
MAKRVNGSGVEITEHVMTNGWRSNRDTLGYDLAQVNHYAIKSREDFLLKRLRGTANSKNKDRIDMGYWDKYDINSQPDASILTDQIQPIIDEWMQDQDLASLMRACHDCAARVLEYQLQVPEFKEFVETGKFPKSDKESKKDAA